MNKQLLVWKLIRDSLQQHIPVVLLYVVESMGSSPGRQGFFMAVNADAKMEGSIGGGIMEHKFVEMAKEKLKEEEQEAFIRKQVHDKSAAKNQSGMICSGEQTIFLYRVQQEDIPHIHNIIDTLQHHKNALLNLTMAGLAFSASIPQKDFEFKQNSEDDWEYAEKIGYKNHLYIIGGGHCALALSQLMHMMEFYIHLYDDRAGLHTMLQNDFVHEKKVIADYTELSQLISPGDNHYVVIMTFGYRTDDTALRALINKQFKYLGLLGSKKKIEKMFDDLRKEDVSEESIEKIHSPIGIQIRSQTPAEIAVSIAAEIIGVKNR